MWPAVLLIPIVALYRIVMAAGNLSSTNPEYGAWLVGFCPLGAVALCAGAFLPRRLALVLPLSILLISDAVIDAHYGAPFFTAAMFGRYALLALIGLAGLWLRQSGHRPGLGTTLLATVAASTFFYAASNTFTWMTSAEYARTLGGWVQALTTGLPGYPPSWYFYRNALVSDSLYSMVFVACLARGVARSTADESLAQPAAAGIVLPR